MLTFRNIGISWFTETVLPVGAVSGHWKVGWGWRPGTSSIFPARVLAGFSAKNLPGMPGMSHPRSVTSGCGSVSLWPVPAAVQAGRVSRRVGTARPGTGCCTGVGFQPERR